MSMSRLQCLDYRARQTQYLGGNLRAQVERERPPEVIYLVVSDKTSALR